MRGSLAWMIAKILKNSDDFKNRYYTIDRSVITYHDSQTDISHSSGTYINPEIKYQRWNDYFSLYLSERGKRGLFAEVAAPGYGKHTLQCLYNLYDFSDQYSKIRRLSKSLLDLWWADWAVEQFDSYRGGSKIRSSRGGSEFSLSASQNAHFQSGTLFSWIYTGVGAKASQNSTVMVAATSDYIIPDVVIDIALDVEGRGEYEIISRRPSANIQPRPESVGTYHQTRIYPLNPDWNGMLKYSYVTPSFIMGCHMSPKYHYSDWYAWGQNLWAGIMFRGNNEAFIYPEALLPNGKRGYTYNSHWAVQNKNTLIIQRNMYGWHVGDMRVWFGASLFKDEEEGWVFVEAERAYAAVRVVFGGYSWDTDNWLRLTNRESPIIFEAACKEKYEDFRAFKDDVLSNKLVIQGELTNKLIGETDAFTMRNDVLYYEGILDSGSFTFFFKSSRTPKVNNIPVDYSPDFTFSSPFISQYPYASDQAIIKKGNRLIELDFSLINNYE